MDVRQTETVKGYIGPARDGIALASLRGHQLDARFCAWRGESDRRYVTSVYTVDPTMVDCGLPSFDGAVVMAVDIARGSRRPIDIVAIERESERRFMIARALARGADEWHVHLLAGDRQGRAAVVSDLILRHGCMPVAISA